MAQNKGDAERRTLDPRADESPEELERKARHQEEEAPRGDVTDREVGEDRILQKGLSFDEADEESARERREPLSDRSSPEDVPRDRK